MKYLLPFSKFRCWWCCSCSPSKLEVFEEGHCVVHEPCASVANCWLVWEVAGGDSRVPQTLWGRYEMCIQMDVDCVFTQCAWPVCIVMFTAGVTCQTNSSFGRTWSDTNELFILSGSSLALLTTILPPLVDRWHMRIEGIQICKNRICTVHTV